MYYLYCESIIHFMWVTSNYIYWQILKIRKFIFEIEIEIIDSVYRLLTREKWDIYGNDS